MPMRIMLIDDNQDDLLFTRIALKRSGLDCEVIEFEHAEKALELVRGGFEQGKFGFIDLLDTQRTTAEARLAYQQKLLELNIAQAELEALLATVPSEANKNRTPKKPE